MISLKSILFVFFLDSILGYGQVHSIDSSGIKKPPFINLNYPGAIKNDTSGYKSQQINIPKAPKLSKPLLPDSTYFRKFSPQSIKKTFAFHGAGFLESRYSNWKDTLTNMPPSFIRVMVSPIISIGSIPLTGNLFYSTEQGPVAGNLKNIILRFDYQQYYNSIYQRIYGQKQSLLQTLGTSQYKKPALDLDFDNQMSNYENQLKNIKTPDMSDLAGTWQGTEGAAKARLLGNFDQLEKLSVNKRTQLLDSVSKRSPWKISQLKQLMHFDTLLNLKDKRFNQILDSLKIHDTAQYKVLMDLKQARDIKKFNGNELQNKQPELQKTGLISKTERILLGFKKFGIGDNYPMYTPYSLMGMKIRGVDIQYCPSHYIFSFTGGVSPQVRAINRFVFNQDNKNVLAGSIGYGQLNSTYIRISYVEARSHSGVNYDSLIYPPSRNFSQVYTTDFACKLTKSILIKGELAHSNLSNQVQLDYYPEHPIVNNTPLLTKNMNWAGNLTLKYTDNKLNYALIGEAKEIEPNYISYAMPFLRTNYLQYQFKLQKQIFQKQVTFEAFWVNEVDNLSGRQPASSKINSLGGSVGLYFNKFPYLLLSYSPTSMSTQSFLDTFHSQSSYKTYTAQAGYQTYVGGLYLLSTVNAFAQEENFTISSQMSHHKMIWISEMVNLKIPLSINVSMGYLNIKYDSILVNSENFDGELTYKFSKESSMGLGLEKDIDPENGNKIVMLLKYNILIQKRHEICLLASKIDTYSVKDETRNHFYDVSLKYVFKW